MRPYTYCFTFEHTLICFSVHAWTQRQHAYHVFPGVYLFLACFADQFEHDGCQLLRESMQNKFKLSSWRVASGGRHHVRAKMRNTC